MMKNKFLRPLIAYLIAEVNNFWLTGLIPFNKLPFSHFWTVACERAFSVLCSLLLIRILSPSSLRRFTYKLIPGRSLGTLAAFAFMSLPIFFSLQFNGNTFVDIGGGFFFALFIGIDEEIFDRGFVFGLLQARGIWIAAVLSSIQFGLMHFGNYLWGEQSLSYTCGQMVDAASFGFVCVGLMLYSGSIWVPILLHGLTDWPMQLETPTAFKTQVVGHVDWMVILVSVLINAFLGAMLIYGSQTGAKEKYAQFLGCLNLTEKPAGEI
jgi:membrane protease YdiL (CAAX protease family)